MSIARARTVVGSLYGLMRNALGLNVATPLEEQELSCTVAPDRRLVVLGHEPIAGYARDHGTVADEAAMLALHTLDSTTLLAEPTFVAPGDSCLRADDPGWRWHCIAGHGTTLAEWERRPLGGALEGLATSGHTHAISAVTGLQAALDGKQAALANAAVVTALGDTGGVLTYGGAPVCTGGSGGAISLLTGLRHWVVGRESDDAAVDLVDNTEWTWSGTRATAAGKIGRALSFGGASYVSRALTGNRFFRDGFTRAAWVKPTASPAGMFLSALGGFFAACTSYQYYTSSTGRIIAPISTDGANDLSGFTNVSDTLSTSTWVLIVQCYCPTGRAYSYRFSEAITVSGSLNNPPAIYDGPNPTLYLGAGNATDIRRWQGLVDSWALWDRALSPTEIRALWNGGAGLAFAGL